MTTTTDTTPEIPEAPEPKTTNRLRLIYAPEGAEPKVWVFDPDKLMLPETIAIEKATGMDYGSEFLVRLGRLNVQALRALLWVLLKRDGARGLKLDQVSFSLGEITLEDPDEDDEPEDPDDDEGP